MSRPTTQGAVTNVGLPLGWRLALYASVVLSVIQLAGNMALFTVRPPRHWPVLESVETLYVASLIPIALLLHRLNRASPFGAPLTIVGILAIIASAAISVGFVSGMAAFGRGFIGGPAYWVSEATVFLWLPGATGVAWRLGKLPGIMVPLTFVYPVWGVMLERRLNTYVT